MDKVYVLIEALIEDESMISSVLSNVRNKERIDYHKVNVRPIEIKGARNYHFSYHQEKKVIHENLNPEEAIEKLKELMKDFFRQGQFYTKEEDYQILISKKGKATILKKAPTKTPQELAHNRKKKYLIPENLPCSFMIRLGVMNEKGKVLANKYDKFRQINRFLEMVADIIPYLENRGEVLQILDFGCGKSYLTFALYHYLREVLNMEVNILGLDLKEDVVRHCNEIACDLGYEALKFITGDIQQFTGREKVHMVVSLHACDTATDAALVKAMGWDAEVILSVPCCQHELLGQIHNPLMKTMEKHGIIKERLSSLITDSIRANILEIMGYSTQILEFIDMEHTAKNLLIRAVKTNKESKTAIAEYKAFKSFWQVEPYLEKALGEDFQKKLGS